MVTDPLLLGCRVNDGGGCACTRRGFLPQSPVNLASRVSAEFRHPESVSLFNLSGLCPFSSHSEPLHPQPCFILSLTQGHPQTRHSSQLMGVILFDRNIEEASGIVRVYACVCMCVCDLCWSDDSFGRACLSANRFY